MTCLWCMEEPEMVLGWSNFLTLNQATGLCEKCVEQLQFLGGSRCKICSRETITETCSDCEWWAKQSEGDPLLKNASVFHYNNFMKEIITKWKYRGDYILREIFKAYFLKNFLIEFKNIKKQAIIVPIPLSNERLKERGFNQAASLAAFLPGKQRELLIRKHGEKQSKKRRKDRIHSQNPFILIEAIQKPVILVDDIYTTGTTLRHAAQLLKEKGCPAIYSYTLIRG